MIMPQVPQSVPAATPALTRNPFWCLCADGVTWGNPTRVATLFFGVLSSAIDEFARALSGVA